MHQNFTLLGLLGRIIAHPGIDRQRKKAAINIHLQRLDQRKLLLVAVALKEIEIVVAFFFTSDIGLSPHFLQNILNIPRRHQAVAESGVERYLLRLHLNV